jgi:hypothetical protein
LVRSINRQASPDFGKGLRPLSASVQFRTKVALL